MKPVRRAALYEGAAVIGVMVAAMWLIEAVNAIDGQGLDGDGIYPRSLAGLPGIISSPFLHASFTHLIGNTIPLVILGLVIAAAGARRVIEVTVVVALVAGLGTWLVGPSHVSTIGASGIVFGYAGFLIMRGFFMRSFPALAIGVIVAILFGASLAADLVPQAGVSWQDHLFGALGGVLAARLVSGGRGSQTILP
ncbi:MAG TPA: rhomboid family intramembrane serine protease [Solirubrobacteraceae bacterium]